MEPKTDRPPLNAAQFLSVTRVYIEKLTEFMLRDIDEHIRLLPTLDVVDETYKQAYWRKFGRFMGDLHQQLTRTPANNEEKWNLILDVYGDQFPELPSTGMRPDVKSRLNWLKRRIAKEFEVEFTRQINANVISSPIEQIFLLEWKFVGLDKKLNVRLAPHEPVDTEVGSYTVDFLIVPEDPSLENVKIAIELDGHEFHEKTQQQVRKDKARERAIVQQGVTVLRFSGSEVVRDGRGCVEEVEKFLRKTIRPTVVPATTV
jgi:very-short-patch-repair endonuclease